MRRREFIALMGARSHGPSLLARSEPCLMRRYQLTYTNEDNGCFVLFARLMKARIGKRSSIPRGFGFLRTCETVSLLTEELLAEKVGC